MRAVIQRVSEASVTIEGRVAGRIGVGLVVLVGVEEADGPDDVAWLSGKIVRMRIFSDVAGQMNRSVRDVAGGVLLISQFTLHASTRKGNRPSFVRAARPEMAEPLYEALARQLAEDLGRPIATGQFGADMKVALVNDGPVTLWIDTRDLGG